MSLRVNDSNNYQTLIAILTILQISLYELRDFVFKDRVDTFHWDLESSAEMKHCGLFMNLRIILKKTMIIMTIDR